MSILDSPLRTTPYYMKYEKPGTYKGGLFIGYRDPDYRALPVSKARKRKMEHLRSLPGKPGWNKSRAIHYAIHGMNMPGNDIVEALNG